MFSLFGWILGIQKVVRRGSSLLNTKRWDLTDPVVELTNNIHLVVAYSVAPMRSATWKIVDCVCDKWIKCHVTKLSPYGRPLPPTVWAKRFPLKLT